MVMSNMNETDVIGKLVEKGGGQFLRALLERALQDLIDLEASATIGAGKYERSAERTNLRNGTRDREFDTRAGTLQLQVPKLRTGSFFPNVLEPRRRARRPFCRSSRKPTFTALAPERWTK